MAKLEDPGWRASLMEEVAGLWKDRKLCDMVIVSKDGQRFSAHSIILSAASPVLKEMIAGGNREITFDQSSSETCSALLNFIYTGELLFDCVEKTTLMEEVKEIMTCLHIPRVLLTNMLNQTSEGTELKPNSLDGVASNCQKSDVSSDKSCEVEIKQEDPSDSEAEPMLEGQEFVSEAERAGQSEAEGPGMEEQSDSNATVDYFSEDKTEVELREDAKPRVKKKARKTKRSQRNRRDAKTDLMKAKCGFCGMVSKLSVTKRHVYEQHFDKIVNTENSSKEFLKIKCIDCDEEIVREDLNVHVLLQHPAPAEKKTNRGRYQKMRVGCLYCEEVVRNVFYMEHLEEKHPEEAKKFEQPNDKGKEVSKFERAPASVLNASSHLLPVNCVYCEDMKEFKCDKYKAHVEECHPDFAEIKISHINSVRPVQNGTPETVIKPTKEMVDKANYLYIDRSRCLPEKPAPPDLYVCHLCGEGFKCKRSFYRHAKIQHGFKKVHCCDYCYMFFKDGFKKVNHEDDEHAIEKYLCETCGKDFVRSSSLKIHKQFVHLGLVRKCELFKRKPPRKENVLCSFCGKSFNRTSHLKQHIACKHNSTKPHACDICGKSFSLQSYLKSHKKTHVDINERKFACTFCSYKCNKRHMLLMHLRIHTGEKPFKCSFCGSRFRISLTLRWHLENKHDLKLGGQGVFQQYYEPETEEPSKARQILQTAYGDSDDEVQLQGERVVSADVSEKGRFEEELDPQDAEEIDFMDSEEVGATDLSVSRERKDNKSNPKQQKSSSNIENIDINPLDSNHTLSDKLKMPQNLFRNPMPGPSAKSEYPPDMPAKLPVSAFDEKRLSPYLMVNVPPTSATEAKVAHPVFPKKLSGALDDANMGHHHPFFAGPSEDNRMSQHLLTKGPSGSLVEDQRATHVLGKGEAGSMDEGRMAQHLFTKGLEMIAHPQTHQPDASNPTQMRIENEPSFYNYPPVYQPPYNMYYQ